MHPVHVRRHTDNSIDYDFHRRRAAGLRAEEMGKSGTGPIINLARKVAVDRRKAEQRDHAVVLVRQWLKDAKAYPAMFKQIALLEAVAGALGVIDGSTD
jgi:hypothetical protein